MTFRGEQKTRRPTNQVGTAGNRELGISSRFRTLFHPLDHYCK